MLVPKRTKYRRPHRLSYEGRAKGGTTVVFAIPFADANWQWSGTPLCIETATGTRQEPVITNKTANGFTIQLASATAGTVEGKIIHA